MKELKVDLIKIGDGHLSVHVQREEEETTVEIKENTTGYEVIQK